MTPLPCSHHLNRSVVATIEIYDYHEDNIFVMTDEEENKSTKHWPSKENIVSFLLTGARALTRKSKFQLLALDDLVCNASNQDAFLFYCELLRCSAFSR
jgi:hypothetical protein